MPAIFFRPVEASNSIAQYNDLEIFKPDLPHDWYYLGPIAKTLKYSSNESIIVRALEADAFADVLRWEIVIPSGTVPPPSFSTWRGIAPEGYVVIGHVFVAHDKPFPVPDTEGIRAIRKDLIQEAAADHLIWIDTATKATLQRESDSDNSDNSCISSKAFISQLGNDHQNHSRCLLSKSNANTLCPEAELQLFYFLQHVLLGRKVNPTVVLHQLLDDAFKKVMESQGQKAIFGALIMLTELEKMLPDNMTRPLNDKLVSVFYEMMPHPPRSMAGVDWRSEDGSDNLGKAGMPYARSVPTQIGVNKDLPKAEDVFDALLKRQEHDAVPNPAISSLLFAFGTLVIHSVFNTDFSSPLGKHIAVNKSSSYVDLSNLYGNNKAEVDEMRDAAAGRGLLCPDCFSDKRLLILPPAAAVLLVLFNRNHNYIAEALLKENERKKWSEPPPEDKRLRERQDEEIFQTARLINCIHFANVVITDYVGGIMGVPKRGGGWPANAEPFDEIDLNGHKVSRGDGNLVSVEFNIIYHWHSTLSEPDVERVKDSLKRHDSWKKLEFPFCWDPNCPCAEKVTQLVLKPQYRTFAGLERGKNGTFADDQLAELIYDATEAPAGLFRARGTPEVLKFVEVKGIERARDWNVCTLNEYRKWIGLPPYSGFKEWNANTEIAEAAQKLYGNIDKLEMYPGMHAEGNPDDGLGSEYDPLRVATMRNAILFDAISLIRGDRFFTYEFTPENLTKWGWNDVQRQYPSKAFGGHLHKLLFRLLPNYFPENSIYSWFPMALPGFMENNKNLPPGSWDFKRPVVKTPLA